MTSDGTAPATAHSDNQTFTPALRLATVCTTAAFVDLTRAVLDARPEYAPQIASGQVSIEQWVAAKTPQWRRMLVAADGTVVAHVGAKGRSDGPGVELCRLMVHPQWQRQGLASHLVDMAVHQFGTRLFALVGPETPSHHVLRRMEWVESGTAVEPGEPGTCVVLTCPFPHGRHPR